MSTLTSPRHASELDDFFIQQGMRLDEAVSAKIHAAGQSTGVFYVWLFCEPGNAYSHLAFVRGLDADGNVIVFKLVGKNLAFMSAESSNPAAVGETLSVGWHLTMEKALHSVLSYRIPLVRYLSVASAHHAQMV